MREVYRERMKRGAGVRRTCHDEEGRGGSAACVCAPLRVPSPPMQLFVLFMRITNQCISAILSRASQAAPAACLPAAPAACVPAAPCGLPSKHAGRA